MAAVCLMAGEALAARRKRSTRKSRIIFSTASTLALSADAPGTSEKSTSTSEPATMKASKRLARSSAQTRGLSTANLNTSSTKNRAVSPRLVWVSAYSTVSEMPYPSAASAMPESRMATWMMRLKRLRSSSIQRTKRLSLRPLNIWLKISCWARYRSSCCCMSRRAPSMSTSASTIASMSRPSMSFPSFSLRMRSRMRRLLSAAISSSFRRCSSYLEGFSFAFRAASSASRAALVSSSSSASKAA
mmetsp:Transcript_9569/g.15974  ORF Transcript_9569/g.15974 Transcript_9569/m.15974 type:complete len:245 (+) Transcript_9569:1746-2480(+)